MEIEEIYRQVAPKLQNDLTGSGSSYATACDIVQETFLRLWKRREDLSDDLSQVSGLVFTIARNYRNDLAPKARHETLSDATGVVEEDLDPADVQGDARPGEIEEETATLKRRLRATLERMPVPLLETFALSRLGKLSVKDIASGTSTSEANVKVRVHRARALFKTGFSEGDEGGRVGAGDGLHRLPFRDGGAGRACARICPRGRSGSSAIHRPAGADGVGRRRLLPH